eukprot:CAMPEP_0196731198 /NCGR_PEP_ID=MMETSP1091-20130531/11032_1 /TAXON_ID=302021 /ORGANISM="Rhodomonas sp., Strain CCMP768" /LENGTH=71 /DNA_ID=CAMNT_0042074319 /DNA_START=1 /DNA_END=213 /DNA_ORIENTATION=+
MSDTRPPLPKRKPQGGGGYKSDENIEDLTSEFDEEEIEKMGRRNQEVVTMVSRQQATVEIVWPARNEAAFQ